MAHGITVTSNCPRIATVSNFKYQLTVVEWCRPPLFDCCPNMLLMWASSYDWESISENGSSVGISSLCLIVSVFQGRNNSNEFNPKRNDKSISIFGVDTTCILKRLLTGWSVNRVLLDFDFFFQNFFFSKNSPFACEIVADDRLLHH